jgi:hypothetical protein
MVRLALIVIVSTTLMAGVAADAENQGGSVAPELSKPTPGRLLDQDYLTSTGATVPRPGLPQSAGETPLDRSIEQQDDRIDNSICKGC